MKNYKIIRVAGLHYISAMQAFSCKSTEGSYKELQNILFSNAYTYGDSFSRAIRSLGHEAEEIVYDFEWLQKKWAQEADISYRNAYWQWDILLAQIEKMHPDILFFQDLHSLPFDLRKGLKVRFPFLKLVVIFRGFPGINESLLKELSTADLLLVGSPILERKCRESGLHPHLVYHYFDEAILQKIPAQIKKHDFTFVGSSGYGYGNDHLPRYQALVELLQKTNLEVWGDEQGQKNFQPPKQLFKNLLRNTLNRFLQIVPDSGLALLGDRIFLPLPVKKVIEQLQRERASLSPTLIHKPLNELFPHRCHSPVFGLEMYQLLSISKVTFNKHTAPAAGTADNIRLFQATGVGSCLLTDHGENMRDLFEPDREIVTYRSMEECIEKVNYLLEHEVERELIAHRGQMRTLKNHTALQRCFQIDEIIQNALRGNIWVSGAVQLNS